MATHFTRRGPVKKGPRLANRGLVLISVSVLAVLAGSYMQERVVTQLGLFGITLTLISLLLCWVNVKKLEIVRLAPPATHAMEDFRIELVVTNHKPWMDSFALEIEDSLLPFANRGLLANWIRAGGHCRMAFSTRLVKRGVLRQASVTVTSEFPFGLCRIAERRKLQTEITIYPRAVTPRSLEHHYESDYMEGTTEGLLTRDMSGDLHGIREFQPGDPVKSIHWPATARAGRPMIREFDQPMPEKYSIVFHSYCPQKSLIWPDAFETSMELLAGLLYYCAQKQVPIDFTASFNGWRTVQVQDPRDLSTPLSILAEAAHQPNKTLNRLVSTIDQMPGRHALFVFSETPVKLWASKLPSLPRPVTCLDNADVQIRTPIFRTA
ncbi:MAG: hypothetical protein ACI8T1_004070 [Verrucomicrobiales bacterium]|jgi:uncharacterized protein (DUF58 family)